MSNPNQALSNEIDKTTYKQVGERVDLLSKEVMEMVRDIVDNICGDLDDYMKCIDNILKDVSNPVTDIELDDFVMNLTLLLYFVSDKQEQLGVEEDVAKAVHKEVFNRVREKAQGTVPDKNTAADLASQNEAIVFIVKSRAYRIIKSKVEMGFEMVNSLKKVMSRRIAELGLSSIDRG